MPPTGAAADLETFGGCGRGEGFQTAGDGVEIGEEVGRGFSLFGTRARVFVWRCLYLGGSCDCWLRTMSSCLCP